MNKQVSIRDGALFLAIIFIWLFFTLMSPSYIGARNLSMLSIEVSTTAVAALGVLLIILCGHIDLAIGSGIGLFGGLAAVLTTWHGWPAPAAMFVSLIAAIAIWTLMGAIVVKEKVPAFIITLGGLLVFKGVFWLVINTSTVPVNFGGEENFYSILTTYYVPPLYGYLLATLASVVIAYFTLRSRKNRIKHHFEVEDKEIAFYKFVIKSLGLFIIVTVLNMYRGVPLSGLILVSIAIIIHIITSQLVFGRYLYAIGGNEEAAEISGVPVKKTSIIAFSIAGALVAVTGFLQTSYAGSSTTSVGDLMELDAIAACVIGGVSLKGGKGTVMGVLAGAFIMASLMNGLTLLSAPPEIKFITRGLVLTLAVWMDVRLNNKTA